MNEEYLDLLQAACTEQKVLMEEVYNKKIRIFEAELKAIQAATKAVNAITAEIKEGIETSDSKLEQLQKAIKLAKESLQTHN